MGLHPRDSCATMHTMDDPLLTPVVEAAREELKNPRFLSDRIAVGREIWRELVIGFAQQLGTLDLNFTQLAALYAVGGTRTLTIGDLAEQLGRSPSATSRLVSGLVESGYLEREEEVADRRQYVLSLTSQGQTLLATVDHARADQFLDVVRPLPVADRALVAMGVAALASHAMNRRGAFRRRREGGPS
jgi:DNA-binding MarR family transcriptional regulator